MKKKCLTFLPCWNVASDLETKPLMAASIQPVLDWLAQEVLLEPTPPLSAQRLAGAIGFSVGVIGAYAVYPFGREFGELVAKQLGVEEDPHALEALKTLFGVITYLPIIALAGLPTQAHFISFFSPKGFDYNKISKKNQACLRAFLNGLTAFLGLFAALSPAYLAYLALEKNSLATHIAMGIFSYLSGFMFKIDAQRRLIDKTFNIFSQGATPEISQDRRFLIRSLMRGMTFIQTSDDNTFNNTFDYLLNSNFTINDRTKRLFSLTNNPVDQDNTTSYSIPRILTELTGFTIGCASSYIYYALGHEIATKWMAWSTGYMSDGSEAADSEQAMQELIAACILIPWAAVHADSTWRRFEKFYLYVTEKNATATVTNRPWLRKFFTAMAWISGFTSDIPHLILTLDATKDMSEGTKGFLNTAAVIGPTCVNSEALDNLLNKGWDHVIEPWINPTATTKMKRDRLTNILLTVQARLEKLPDAQIILLKQFINSSAPSSLLSFTNSNININSSTINTKTGTESQEVSYWKCCTLPCH